MTLCGFWIELCSVMHYLGTYVYDSIGLSFLPSDFCISTIGNSHRSLVNLLSYFVNAYTIFFFSISIHLKTLS